MVCYCFGAWRLSVCKLLLCVCVCLYVWPWTHRMRQNQFYNNEPTALWHHLSSSCSWCLRVLHFDTNSYIHSICLIQHTHTHRLVCSFIIIGTGFPQVVCSWSLPCYYITKRQWSFSYMLTVWHCISHWNTFQFTIHYSTCVFYIVTLIKQILLKLMSLKSI